MKKINIGIIGYGTIGSAVDKLISENGPTIADRTGIDINVLKISDTNPKIKNPKLVHDAYSLIENPDISIVVEAIGGEKPALDFILSAIDHGKHVVTSNKEVIALHGDKIFSAAQKMGVFVKFEASVGGGIPIIGPLSSNLLSNDVTEVFGIVNGTTNFILSKMSKEGTEFADALKEAQAKGYAEANPKKDIDGYDASYKAAILASVAFNAKVDWKKVYFEGVSRISQEDIRFADEIGYVIKLLAIAKKTKDGCEIRVHPTLIPKDHQLAYVSGAMNAIYVKGNAVGELMFYGQGAGGRPTASAVVSDIISIASSGSKPQTAKQKEIKIKPIGETVSRYYIRLSAPDKHGVLAGISKAFSDHGVSIAAVMQKETIGNVATIVIIIHEAKEANLRKALSKLSKLAVVKKICNIIRVGL